MIVLLYTGIFFFIKNRREHSKLVERIKKETFSGQSEEMDQDSSKSLAAVKNWFLNVFNSLGRRTPKPKSEEELSRMRKSFLNAGYRGQNTTIIFFGIKTFCAIVFAAGFFFLKLVFFLTITPGYLMFFTIVLAIIGFYLPDIWLLLRIAQRKRNILDAFPDALDLMVVCVEAGMGLDAALKRVGDEIELNHPVLSDELNILNLEMRAGKLRQHALRNLALRTGLDEVSSFVTLLIQTEKFGTSIGKALRVHSDSMRVRRYQRAEETATKLPVKLVFPLILCIFPSLFVVILGPAVIKIFRIFFPAISGG
jgi:tight adherence protein C